MSKVKLYSTMSRTVEQLAPIQNDKITLYTCGLTVYSQPHIGNWVSYIYWDILVRSLKTCGYEVTHVQNITDVGHLTSDEDAGEDKMLKSALQEGTTAWEVAEKYIQIADYEAYNQLGLLRPDHMPRATDYIQQQIEFVKVLEQKGFTYTIADGVYFDTSNLKDYGKLAKLDIDGLQFGARVENTGKKNPTDFALWKFSPSSEKRDMEWESPWGVGFPGWHLECSVMALSLLGDTIDIHAGGIDHIPVHHVNEIAQSETYTGHTFANIWIHANHIKVDGTKMSKSLGNIYTLSDIKEKGFDLEAFKLTVISKHYRTEGNFTWDILEASQNLLNRFKEWSDLQFQALVSEKLISNYESAIVNLKDAICNDLNTPEALRVIVGMLNAIDDFGVDSTAVSIATKQIDSLFGLKLHDRVDITDEQKQLIVSREDARKNSDWSASDALRLQLLNQGISLRDTPLGQLWARLQ